jgi:Fe2+ transport system protein FeoA
LPQSPIALTALSESEEAEIVRVDGNEALHLSGFGFYPGVLIQVIQRFPSYIIKTDQTEVALENDVASKIWVKYVDPDGDSGQGGRRRRRRRIRGSDR